MAASPSSTSTSGVAAPQPVMDKRLLKAAIDGDSPSMRVMASQDQRILLGVTPQGNTCLHISSIYGHQVFCNDCLGLDESLLAAVNLDGETPLIAAVTNGHVSLASFLLGRCHQQGFRQQILQQDMHGCNALYYAIRGGHKELALELIHKEPALSQAVTRFNESAMHAAAIRDYTDVIEKLLNIPDSSHAGLHGKNALHSAVKDGHTESAAIIMRIRPEMARGMDNNRNTPIRLAVLFNKVEVLRVLLEHDRSLGYEVEMQTGYPLLLSAAFRGHIDIAREILSYCPDAPYRTTNGYSWLHEAVFNEHAEFVEFVVRTPQFGTVINMQDQNGKTALHWAVRKCNPRIVATLLSHKDIDVTVQDNWNDSAAWELWKTTDQAKTLNWNEVCMLMVQADPRRATALHNLHKEARKNTTIKSRKDAKSLTQTYTCNTSLVAILIATITFAAAFTLPGGYSSDAGSEGLPIMSKKFSFQVFLNSDVLAMCSSFAVAFICIISRWEDYEFLLYYRSYTKKLMWFAYVATTTAFSTGLYTVLASRLHWLAIAICVLVALLPIFTWLLGKWPVLKLRFRLGKSFRSDFLDMV